ncbi:hypothetical protein HDU84_000610 [Entophlyctis sp. JEL0112]|nr:hypothetical protein HDU84_000610 [Entophlyctis sp. JEL0112]
MTMFHLYRILLPARQLKWTLVNYVGRFRFVNLRLSLVKSANDKQAQCQRIYHHIPRYQSIFQDLIRFTNGPEIFDYVAILPIELVIRPESAISVKTVDSDTIDAELEALGIKGDGDDVGGRNSPNKQVMKNLQDVFRVREQIVDNLLMLEISVNKRGHAYETSQATISDPIF